MTFVAHHFQHLSFFLCNSFARYYFVVHFACPFLLSSMESQGIRTLILTSYKGYHYQTTTLLSRAYTTIEVSASRCSNQTIHHIIHNHSIWVGVQVPNLGSFNLIREPYLGMEIPKLQVLKKFDRVSPITRIIPKVKPAHRPSKQFQFNYSLIIMHNQFI